MIAAGNAGQDTAQAIHALGVLTGIHAQRVAEAARFPSHDWTAVHRAAVAAALTRPDITASLTPHTAHPSRTTTIRGTVSPPPPPWETSDTSHDPATHSNDTDLFDTPTISVIVTAAAVTILNADDDHDIPGTQRNSDPDARVLTIPAHRRAATPLLTTYADLFTDTDRTILRAWLTRPDIDLTSTPDTIALTTPWSKALQTAVKRAGGTWNGNQRQWTFPIAKAAVVDALRAQFDLTADPDTQQRFTDANGPLLFDGTIEGLKGIPLTDLNTIAAAKNLDERLTEFGLTNIWDLLHHIPIRYIDRSASGRIRDLPVGDTVAFVATVKSVTPYDRMRKLCRLTVADDTASISITFFRAPWIAQRFRAGDAVTVHGKLDTWDGGRNGPTLQMSNPLIDLIGDDPAPVLPIYAQSAKSRVTTWEVHSAATEAITRLDALADPVPPEVVAAHNLLGRLDAYRAVHRPTSLDHAEAGRQRLVFDELLRMQLALGVAHDAAAAQPGVTHTPTGALTRQILADLPYGLTGAQQRALQALTADLAGAHPMHRLLQGDVGAGKTTIAAVAASVAVESRHQAAVMAPTEILAQQLFREFHDIFTNRTHPDGTPIRVEFLGGRTTGKKRAALIADLAAGGIDIVVGTHALLVDDVQFASLGLVVVDEQHRFGVEQRAALRGKGGGVVPDVLVMTATPIPRTAAMTVFGDLDVTVLDELPPGRTPIATTWLGEEPNFISAIAGPWADILNAVGQGRQAYVVCPLVDESESVSAAAAEDAFEQLSHGALAGLRLGLVHGKQKAADRDPVMAAFKNGDLDVLVATTVIEVGVNVPNATIMVILDAPRFGLAQLHQLRGRVGRGQHTSTCWLYGKANSSDSVDRMKVLVATTDGFKVAAEDLRLRGEGAILGTSTAQSGRSDLKVTDLQRDMAWVQTARDTARTLLNDDPQLARRPGLRSEITASLGDEAAQWLTRN